MIKKMESIFHSLQEAIITIDISGVNFTNKHGKKILTDIKNYKFGLQDKNNQGLLPDQSSNTLQAKNNKSLDQAEYENKISRAQVFKLYKNNMNDKNEQTCHQGSRSEIIEKQASNKQEMYSLYDMCKTDIEALDQMIFMLDHYCDASEKVDANQLKDV